MSFNNTVVTVEEREPVTRGKGTDPDVTGSQCCA